jgi:hypothetical protein
MTSVSRTRASLAIGLVVLGPLGLLVAACSSPPEQRYLTQFFRAARTRDNATLAMMSAVMFEPRTHGEVISFNITEITPERREPVSFKPLLEADRRAQSELEETRKGRVEFENANRPALEAISKLESDPNARFTPAQQKLKAEWDKWRGEVQANQKAVSSARSAVSASSGPAEASLSQPGQPALDMSKFEGDLVTKDVTIDAKIRTPDGQETNKTLVITIQRAEGTQDGAPRQGRPVITRIQGM